jgi:hypothetical protein
MLYVWMVHECDPAMMARVPIGENVPGRPDALGRASGGTMP